MTLIIILSLLVLFVGLIVYLMCAGATKATFAEVGKMMFFCGLLAFLMSYGSSANGCSIQGGTVTHSGK